MQNALLLQEGASGPGSEAAATHIASNLGSLWEIAVQGGPVMVPIALCSVLVLAYCVERFMMLRRGKIMPTRLVRDLREALAAGRIDAARRRCEEDGSPLAAIALAGLRLYGFANRMEIEKAMEDAGFREVTKLKRNVRPLSTIANLAPLLGLLGTVFGMIQAFNVVAAGGIGKQEMLAGGIAMALITTAAGLSVAIPALALYHWFSGRVQNLVLAIDETLAGFIESLPSVPGSPSAASPLSSSSIAVVPSAAADAAAPLASSAVLPQAVTAGAQP